MFSPATPAPEATATPTMDTLPQGTPSADAPPEMGAEAGITPQDVEAHLDGLPDQDKAFLAEHLTPEFVRAIGLISGPEVAQYLNQFADPNKVLVPVPRQLAEQYLAEQGKGQGPANGQPQGQPMPQPQAPAQVAPQSAPPAAMPQGGGMMAPKM